jgi:hypothetical protein
MADNTVLNIGTGGDTIANEDVGGVKFPVTKITLGAHGTNSGPVAVTNPLPVNQKPVASSLFSPSISADFGSNTTHLISAATNNILSLCVTNSNASTRYFQLHMTGTGGVPTGGEVPVYSFLVPSNSTIMLGSDFFTLAGKNFATDSSWAWSTTVGTFTNSATASDHTVHLHYVT